jgi:hypothetical protein
MDEATIGDGVSALYEFDWGDQTRTTDEIGDLAEAGFDATMEDIVDVARDDPDCEVRIIGFEQ